MYKKISIVFFVIFVVCFFQVAQASELPSLSVAVNTAEVQAGGSVAYTIVYDNSTGVDYSNVVISMDLAVGSGVNFVSSSLPEFWSGSTPYWRLGDLVDGTSSNINFVVNVSDDIDQESISTSVLLTGEGDSGDINVGASAASVSVVFDDDTEENEDVNDEDEVVDEDADKGSDNMDEMNDPEESKKKEIDFQTNGVKSIDVANVVGGADISAFKKNVNEWDNRFLIIGLVSFGLILSIGLAAYFLGKKSK